MEPLAALLVTLGVIALLGSWILLLIRSSNEDFAWGLCTVLLPPLSYIYGLFRWSVAGESILLAVVGWFLIWLHISV